MKFMFNIYVQIECIYKICLNSDSKDYGLPLSVKWI